MNQLKPVEYKKQKVLTTQQLADIEKLDCACLVPSQIAPIIGADPNWIRWQAHHEKEALGFPVIVIRSRVKVPRIPFIKFMRGETSCQTETQ